MPLQAAGAHAPARTLNPNPNPNPHPNPNPNPNPNPYPTQVVKLQLSGRVLDEHTLESAFSQEELKAFWKPMVSSQADAAVDATFIERTCAAAPWMHCP